jgi:hypothetical protein
MKIVLQNPGCINALCCVFDLVCSSFGKDMGPLPSTAMVALLQLIQDFCEWTCKGDIAHHSTNLACIVYSNAVNAVCAVSHDA